MKPSERFKKRYVSFLLKGEGGAPPDASFARQAVHEHFLSFFGELGISSLAFKLVSYDPKSGAGIIRCERGAVEEAIFCMACLHEFQGKNIRMAPISTGGTIRKT